MASSWKKIDTYMALVGKPEVERPLGRYRCKTKDVIQLDLERIRGSVVDWINLVRGTDGRWASANTPIKILFL
jgi:hypothetical protein